MKTSTKIIITVVTVGVVVASVLIAKFFIHEDNEEPSAHIIGGADEPTVMFLAGRITGDRKQEGHISQDRKSIIGWLEET